MPSTLTQVRSYVEPKRFDLQRIHLRRQISQQLLDPESFRYLIDNDQDPNRLPEYERLLNSQSRAYGSVLLDNLALLSNQPKLFKAGDADAKVFDAIGNELTVKLHGMT